MSDTFQITSNSVRVCGEYGIMSTELASLDDLSKALSKNLIGIERSEGQQQFEAKVLLGLQLVKATCDAFIALSAKATEFTGKGGAGQIVSSVYSGAGAAVDAASGGSVARAGLTIASSVAGARAGLAQRRADAFAPYKNNSLTPNINRRGEVVDARAAELKREADLAGLMEFKAGIIHSAFNKDAEALRKDSAGFFAQVGAMAVDAVPNEAAAKPLGALVAIVREADSYNLALQKAVDEYFKNASDENMMFAKAKITHELKKVGTSITKLKQAIAACHENLA